MRARTFLRVYQAQPQPVLSVTSLTCSGSTATAAASGHDFRVGDSVTLSGADQARFNGSFKVTQVTANTFAFELADETVSSATGTIVAQKGFQIQITPPIAGQNRGFYFNTDRDEVLPAEVSELPENSNARYGRVYDRALDATFIPDPGLQAAVAEALDVPLVWKYDPKNVFLPQAVNTATNRVALRGHGLANSEAIQFGSSDSLPAPLRSSVTYYVKVIDSDTVELYADLALSAVVDVTTRGTGSHGIMRSLLAYPIRARELGSLLKLDASARAITDLTGLEYAINLRELNLANNLLATLTPQSSVLGTVNYSPLVPGIRVGRETDGQLGLTWLERLSLDGNQLGNNDLPVLTRLLSLKSLSMDRNTPATGGLAWLEGSALVLRTGSGPGSFTLSVVGQTTIQIANTASPLIIQSALESLPAIGVGNVIVTSLDLSVSVLSFPTSKRLEAKALTVAGTDATLRSLFDPTASEPALYSLPALKGTGQHGGLEFLSLDGITPQAQDIRDLSPLQSLISLRWLSLSNHDIASVLPLIGLSRLEYVYLQNNRITDLGPLAGQLVADDEVVIQPSYLENRLTLTMIDGKTYWTNGWQGNLNPASDVFEGDYRFHRPGDGSAYAQWTFNSLAPGTYQVLVTYPAHEGRASHAPYEIFDGEGLPENPQVAATATATISQKFAPNGDRFQGVYWQNLASPVSISSGTLRVVLRNSADGIVAADAVRIVRVDPAPLKVVDVRGNPLDNRAYETASGAKDGWVGLLAGRATHPVMDDLSTNFVVEGVFIGALASSAQDQDAPQFTPIPSQPWKAGVTFTYPNLMVTDSDRDPDGLGFLAATSDPGVTALVTAETLTVTVGSTVNRAVLIKVTAYDGNRAAGDYHGRSAAITFFLDIETGRIQGAKFNDADNNQTRNPNDPNEHGIDGVEIRLDTNSDGTFDLFTVTDINGDYYFANLPLGVYTVGETLNPASVQSYPIMTTPSPTPSLLSAPNASSSSSTVSADGRFVTFASRATNGTQHIYLLDRDTDQNSVFDEAGATQLWVASMDGAGNPLATDSVAPSISGDGRYVVFQNSGNVLLFDRTPAAGKPAIRTVATGAAPVISANGRFVAFQNASNIYVYDRDWDANNIFDEAGLTRLRLVSQTPAGDNPDGASSQPSISADGRWIAFTSIATNLVAGIVDANNRNDIYVYDQLSRTTVRLSVASDGTDTDGLSESPSISADGRFVVFVSTAHNLVQGLNYRGLSLKHVYLLDRDPDENGSLNQRGELPGVRLVSRAWNGSNLVAEAESSLPRISGEGRFVVFYSSAASLVQGDSANTPDAFLFDRFATAIPDQIRRIVGGTEAAISANGRFITYTLGAVVNGVRYLESAGTHKVLTLAPPQQLDPVRNFGNFAIVSIGPDRQIDEGNSISFAANLVAPPGILDGSLTYQWKVFQVTDSNENLVFASTPSSDTADRRLVRYINAGVYRVEFTLQNGAPDKTYRDSAMVYARNVLPVVNLGPDQTTPERTPLSFNALDMMSLVPTDVASFVWTINDAAGLEVATGTGLHFNYCPPEPGRFTLTLTATDDEGSRASDSRTYEVTDVPPVLNLSNLTGGPEGSLLLFDALDYVMLAGDPPVAFEWRVMSGETQVAVGTDRRFEFIPADDGDYTVFLRVKDDENSEASAQHILHVSNVPPMVNLGADFSALEGDRLTLTAWITDPGSNDNHSFVWQVQPPSGGVPADQTSPLEPIFAFRPTNDGEYHVQVTVADGDGGVSMDELIITVINASPNLESLNLRRNGTGPTEPVTESTIAAVEGEPLDFAATVRDAPGDLLSYLWRVWNQADNLLTTSTTGAFSFVPPDNGNYRVEFEASDDDGGGVARRFDLIVSNAVPTPVLDGPTTASEGLLITLEAQNAQLDPGFADVASLIYLWQATSSNGQVIPAGTQRVFRFTPADQGIYAVTLRVEDKDGGVAVATHTIEILNRLPWIALPPAAAGLAGLEFSLAGPWSDVPADSLVATVIYGDGTSGPVLTQEGLFTISHVYAQPGTYTLRVTASDEDSLGVPPSEATATITVVSGVLDRHLFYNNSHFDGNSSIPNAADDAAIAWDKVALLPGATATFANYSNYSRGLNGIMIDLPGLVGQLSAADFEFRTGNDDNPSGWRILASGDIVVRKGAGVAGSDRITITWADHAIENAWIQVRLKATIATGLRADDVFYFGNAVGDTGNASGNAIVDGDDLVAVRQASGGFLNRVGVTSRFDLNRDGMVNAFDAAVARDHSNTSATALRLIAAPMPVPSPAAVVGRFVLYHHSFFDGNNPAPSAADDLAIATDKCALLPGQTASFANYTSYSRGLNGIIVDIQNLNRLPTTADFEFRVGNDSDASQWITAPPPLSITLRLGAGVAGSDRVTILWANGAIRNEWLQVIVRPSAATGLAAEDVFYFGNAVADTGNSQSDARVDQADFDAVIQSGRGFLDPAGVTNRYDFNHDHFVNAFDAAIARDQASASVAPLQLISPSSDRFMSSLRWHRGTANLRQNRGAGIAPADYLGILPPVLRTPRTPFP